MKFCIIHCLVVAATLPLEEGILTAMKGGNGDNSERDREAFDYKQHQPPCSASVLEITSIVQAELKPNCSIANMRFRHRHLHHERSISSSGIELIMFMKTAKTKTTTTSHLSKRDFKHEKVAAAAAGVINGC